jgi:hypothetical protein
VDDQHGQCTSAVWLPVTLAENRDARRNFNKAIFGRREVRLAREKKAGEGLQVSTAQERTRRESLEAGVNLRAPHILILNTGEHFCPACAGRSRNRADIRICLP